MGFASLTLSLDFKYLNDHIRIIHILSFKLWTQNSENPFSLALGKYINSISFPGFWILQFESYLHIYFKWNYRFLAANGKATQSRVWWYKAFTNVDTTGGWQMDSSATDVGTRKGERGRAAELVKHEREGSKQIMHGRCIIHFMLDFLWQHHLQHWDLTGDLRVGLGWRGTPTL